MFLKFERLSYSAHHEGRGGRDGRAYVYGRVTGIPEERRNRKQHQVSSASENQKPRWFLIFLKVLELTTMFLGR